MMKQRILKIDASMRNKGSYSRMLSEKLIEHLAKQATIFVKERNISDGIASVNEAWVNANSTDIKQRTPEQRAVLSCSDALINELKNTDIVVIGLPIYNFNVPSAFKAWIDQVVRSKVTFSYTDNGPEGLLNNIKAYIIVTSGGTQLGSDIDFISNYLHHIFAFIGIKDLTIIDSSGLGRDEEKVLIAAEAQIAKS